MYILQKGSVFKIVTKLVAVIIHSVKISNLQFTQLESEWVEKWKVHKDISLGVLSLIYNSFSGK